MTPTSRPSPPQFSSRDLADSLRQELRKLGLDDPVIGYLIKHAFAFSNADDPRIERPDADQHRMDADMELVLATILACASRWGIRDV